MVLARQKAVVRGAGETRWESVGTASIRGRYRFVSLGTCIRLSGRSLTAAAPRPGTAIVRERCFAPSGAGRLSVGVAVCQRPDPIRSAGESALRFTDSTKRPDRADAVQGTDRQAGRSNSRTPVRCRRISGGTARHADGGACRLRGLVGSAGKLLASGSHDSEPPSPPERLFRGAAVSRRRGPLPSPLVHTCG